MKIKKCKVKMVIKEIIEVVGPISEVDAVFDRLLAEGYTSFGSGHYTNSRMWPEYDKRRFRITAERKYEQAEGSGGSNDVRPVENLPRRGVRRAAAKVRKASDAVD